MPARWLIALSWIELAAGVAGSLRIASDILRGGYRQPMPVMDWVWPITALYLGPVAVWAYGSWGRPRSSRWIASQPASAPPPTDEPWVSTAIGVSHCGAGCTLGDIAAEVTVFGFGLDVAGQRILCGLRRRLSGGGRDRSGVSVLRDRADAWPGAARWDPRRRESRDRLLDRVRGRTVRLDGADDLRLLPRVAPPSASSPVYWFGMQIGMVIGLIAACPVNAWLIRTGVKEAM